MLFAAPERSASKGPVGPDSPDRASSEDARQRRERVCAPYAAAHYPAGQVHEGFEGIKGAYRKSEKAPHEAKPARAAQAERRATFTTVCLAKGINGPSPARLPRGSCRVRALRVPRIS